MSDYFLGEIRVFGFDWAPSTWALCNGASMSVQQNQALYALVGTQFGGDGKSTFNLPDLRGRTPVHTDYTAKPAITPGQSQGTETVALTAATMPAHTHAFFASKDSATTPAGTNNMLAVAQPDPVQKLSRPIYGTGAASDTLNANSVVSAGSGQGHPNMQPFVVVNFCISLQGDFPPRP